MSITNTTNSMIYDNIIEAVRSQNPNHVIINCLNHDGFAIRHQNYQLLRMNDGTVGIISKGINMQFYRGESNVHDTCVASLYRIKDFYDRVIALLRSYEFQLFLETTNEVQEWKRSNLRLDLWSMCQHYEFATPMIDITSEIAVAAFFATHKFDWRINQYVIQKDGIGQIICYFGIAEMDDMPFESFNAREQLTKSTKCPHGIRLIGMQPFNRPGNQDAAGLWLGKDEDMIRQGALIKFRQNEQVNLKLERAMLVGADIFFPHEPVSEAAFMIKKAKVVTSAAIERFMMDARNWLDSVPEERDIEHILEQKHLQIVDAPVVIGTMFKTIRPVAYDGVRPIIRRPALDMFLNS